MDLISGRVGLMQDGTARPAGRPEQRQSHLFSSVSCRRGSGRRGHAGYRSRPLTLGGRTPGRHTRKVVFPHVVAAFTMSGMTADARQRAAAQIRQLARRGLDVPAFWRECNQVLATAVPHYLAPCWFTFDPASLLITSHYDPVIPEISAEFLAHEYRADDVLKLDSHAGSRGQRVLCHDEELHRIKAPDPLGSARRSHRPARWRSTPPTPMHPNSRPSSPSSTAADAELTVANPQAIKEAFQEF
jgi:hypothetical protein